MIVEIKAVKGGKDARLLVKDMFTVYRRAAGRL